MIISKHENSISYNQSLMFIANQQEECTAVIIVDSVSRKYYTSETSWLWDIDFELLQNDHVKRVILGEAMPMIWLSGSIIAALMQIRSALPRTWTR